MVEFFEVSAKSMHTFGKTGIQPLILFKLKSLFGALFLLAVSLNLWGQTKENQPFILSERVGAEIDSIEAEYFNLFPDLDGVKSAVYRKDNLENLQMLVSLSNGTDTTLIFSKLASVELSKYIDKQEILRDSVNLIDWGLLPDYGLSKMNYFEDFGSLLYVHLQDNTLVAGKLMKITDKGLILWQGKQPTRPNYFPGLIKVIKREDIKKIERKQDITGKIFGISLGIGLGIAASNILFLGTFEPDGQDLTNSILAIGVGALAGTGIGLLYDFTSVSRRKYNFESKKFQYEKLKANLKKRSIFSSVYPPEMKKALQDL